MYKTDEMFDTYFEYDQDCPSPDQDLMDESDADSLPNPN
jgi:hypothetical protein